MRSKLFGKYMLLNRIAVGGMAEVFRAKLEGVAGFERYVAIKRILPSVAEDKDFIDMFLDEARIAGQLNHVNICPIYELGRVERTYYIAMEFVDGKDVLQTINRFRRRKSHMPAVMAAWIGTKVCEALAYAHNKTSQENQPLDIVHRDVSPQNILISYEGTVKLIDFGISKASSRLTKTNTGVLKGKFGYMSPEQVKGHPVDGRSDLFALGTCLYEMTTSDRLFRAGGDFETLEKVREARIQPPSERVDNYPKGLEEIILKALQVDPQERWSTAAEMGAKLHAFIGSQKPFGTSALSSWMKTCFQKEMAQEEDLAKQLREAEPDRAVSAPETEYEGGDATVVQEPPLPLPQGGAIAHQSTQIFFHRDFEDSSDEHEDPSVIAAQPTVIQASPLSEPPRRAARATPATRPSSSKLVLAGRALLITLAVAALLALGAALGYVLGGAAVH